MLGNEPVHGSVKLGSPKMILLQESNDFAFLPILAKAGPLDKDGRSALNCRDRIPFEGNPKTPEQGPMRFNLLRGSFATRHIVVLPRTTSRAWAREPKTRSETPKAFGAQDGLLLGGEINLLGYRNS
eukprot:10651555-Heterocapsa_arctica.AAC.1